jgi:hypothetical protein
MDRIKVISNTGERGTIPRDQLEGALAAGYRLDTDTTDTFAAESTRVAKPISTGRAHVVDVQTGEKGTIAENAVEQALKSGYRLESPAEKAVRTYVEDKGPISGRATVIAKSAINQFLFGVPNQVRDYVASPIEIEKQKELESNYPISNALGNVAGFAAGGFGVSKLASPLVRKLVSGMITSRAAAPLTTTAVRAVTNAAIEGAAFSSPQAITDVLYGHPELAGEKLAYGVLGSTLFAGIPQVAAKASQTAAVKTARQALNFNVNKSVIDDLGAFISKTDDNLSKIDIVEDPRLQKIRELSKTPTDNVKLGEFIDANFNSMDEYTEFVRKAAAQTVEDEALITAELRKKRDVLANWKSVQKLLDGTIESEQDIAEIQKGFGVFKDFYKANPAFKKAVDDMANVNSDKLNSIESVVKNVTKKGGLGGALYALGSGDPLLASFALVGSELAPSIGNMARRVANPISRMEYATKTLPYIAKTQQKLSSPVLPFLGARSGVGITETPTPEEYDAMVTKLNELTPEQIINVFADFPVDADSKEQAVNRMTKIVEYARANIPEIPPPDPFSKAPRVPSDQQLYKFGRTMQLMIDPGEFKRRLENNTLTAQDINDMRVMYPDLLRQFQLMMLNEYSQTPVKLPYSIRMKLNMVLGNTPTQQNIQQYQNQFAPKEEGQGSNVNVRPDSIAPMTDTIQMRR